MRDLDTVDLREKPTMPRDWAIFFRDKNKGQYTEECVPTDSCAGDGDCIRVIKDVPFAWQNTLLYSTRFSEGMNYEKYYKAYILEMGACEKGLWIKVDMPLEQGDVLVPQHDNTLEYYVTYADYWENNGGFVLKLRKTDEKRTDTYDKIFEAFAVGKAVNVIGQLK